MHRNPEICEKLTTFFSSGTKLLLPPWLKVFDTRRERERDTIFTMVTVPSDPTMRGASRRPNWTGLAQVQKSTRFVQRQISANSFFKNHQNSQPITSGHDVIHPPVQFPIWGFYYDICDCHTLRAQAWTPALNVCTCTCTKPNSSKSN